MRKLTGPCLAAVALLLHAGAAGAQARTLWATDGYGPSAQGLYGIQGGAIQSQFNTGSNQAYAVAVGSDVRTFGSYSGSTGLEYLFNGTVVGPTATNTITSADYFYDGTTDGTYNYSAAYYGGTVYRGGLDWSGMTPLFSTAIGNEIGITYDSGHNSLWIGQFAQGTNLNGLFEYAMNGTLLSSFTPNVGGNGITALAYDAADQTLWFSNYDQSAQLYQYDRAGNQLNAFVVPGTFNGYLIGGEFAQSVTPEPASMVLLATGLMGIGVVVRRKRTA